jgi:signal transduction histidine kinase
LSIKNEEDKRLYERERVALTALIGNVAHDLKTPLHSFLMSLELLKTRLIKDYDILPPTRSADKDDEHPLLTLRSLNSACAFMKMAINRSLDFAKSSSNIALVPSMETFNIAAALSMPVDMIKHLQSNVEIVVKPLPLNFCEDMISDKHWYIYVNMYICIYVQTYTHMYIYRYMYTYRYIYKSI